MTISLDKTGVKPHYLLIDRDRILIYWDKYILWEVIWLDILIKLSSIDFPLVFTR